MKVSEHGEPLEYFKSPPSVLPAQPLFDDIVEGLPTGAPSVGDERSEESVTPTTPMTMQLCHQPHYITEENEDDETPVIPGLIGPPSLLADADQRKDATPEPLTSRLRAQNKLVRVEDVVFKKVLCETLKSTVCVADWKGQTVVAKRIKPSLFKKADPESAETRETSEREMIHELNLLTTISHPRILGMIGAGFERSQGPIFLTEYMEGGDVETYMRRQRETSLDQQFKPRYSLAIQWIESTAEALAYLHGLPQPIIHRDLKPLNLLLTKDLQLKVTDLGISKVMQSTKHSASTPKKMTGGVGTWRYMAPEVVRHEQYTDRADIYALSLIGYFLLSGRQPFDTFCGRDVEKILKAYLVGHEPRPELGIFIGLMEMRAFLQDTWHIDAPKRPSASECVARLGEIRQHGILHSVSLMTRNFKRSISGPPQA